MRREVILAATPRAPLQARDALNESIAAASLDGLLDDARLVMSEVVTNALLHGDLQPEKDVIRLVIDADESWLHVEVEQRTVARGVQPVKPYAYAPDRVGGFGLHIVDALADDWGVEPGPPGYVWFELRR
jgi:anti-sigma regulatory factor (Ser/Thr protein kinase)